MTRIHKCCNVVYIANKCAPPPHTHTLPPIHSSWQSPLKITFLSGLTYYQITLTVSVFACYWNMMRIHVDKFCNVMYIANECLFPPNLCILSIPVKDNVLTGLTYYQVSLALSIFACYSTPNDKIVELGQIESNCRQQILFCSMTGFLFEIV